MDGCMYTWMDGCMHEWTDGCMHECMDAWMDGLIDEWKDEETYAPCPNISQLLHHIKVSTDIIIYRESR